MFARSFGGTTMGVDGLIIAVEVDSAAGLPAFDIVGLPDTAVRESKERVRTAIRNFGIQLNIFTYFQLYLIYLTMMLNFRKIQNI